jgi:hypothetical protein
MFILTSRTYLFTPFESLSRWQARKEGDKNMRAGIIPSKALQERKILHERSLMENGDTNSSEYLL